MEYLLEKGDYSFGCLVSTISSVNSDGIQKGDSFVLILLTFLESRLLEYIPTLVYVNFFPKYF